MIERIEPESDPEVALRQRGLEPAAWSAPPLTHFPPHSHDRAKRLFVRRGDISFNGEWLHATDSIRIPAQLEHSADVGEAGVECVEAFE